MKSPSYDSMLDAIGSDKLTIGEIDGPRTPRSTEP
jgi:hypothetical protein